MTWCKDQRNCYNSSRSNRLHACCCTSHSESEPGHPEILLTVIETFQTAIVASILTPSWMTTPWAQKLVDNQLQSLTSAFLLFPYKCLLLITTWYCLHPSPSFGSPPASPPIEMRYRSLNELTCSQNYATAAMKWRTPLVHSLSPLWADQLLSCETCRQVSEEGPVKA